jgi:hypothetical protein
MSRTAVIIIITTGSVIHIGAPGITTVIIRLVGIIWKIKDTLEWLFIKTRFN